MLTNRLSRSANGFAGNLIGGMLAGLVIVLAAQSRAQADMREAFKRAIPATVGVEWRDTTGKSPDQIQLSSGTLVSADGFVITVLEAPDSQSYSVTLSDGRVFPAKLIVDDRRSRLKLLKVEATELPFLEFSKEPLSIGDDVATSSCDDLTSRVASKGYVVALDKELTRFGEEFRNQLELTVGPMSAGAPVFDNQGKLCGIIAAAISGKSISYAASISQIQAVLDAPRGDLPKIIRRGRIGVVLAEDQKSKGQAIVRQVVNGSTGAAAGLQEGDWIQAFNGVTISSGKDLFRRISRCAAGETVQLTIRRDGEEQNRDISVALDPIQDDYLKTATSSTGNRSQKSTAAVVTRQWVPSKPVVTTEYLKEPVTVQYLEPVAQPSTGETGATAAPQKVTKSVQIKKPVVVQPQVTIRKEITPKKDGKPKPALKALHVAPVVIGANEAAIQADVSEVWQAVVPSIRIERTEVDKAIEEIKVNMAEQAKREIDEQKEKQKLVAELEKQREQIKRDREELDKVRAQLERDRQVLKQFEKVLEELRSVSSKLPQGNPASVDAGNEKK